MCDLLEDDDPDSTRFVEDRLGVWWVPLTFARLGLSLTAKEEALIRDLLLMRMISSMSHVRLLWGETRRWLAWAS